MLFNAFEREKVCFVDSNFETFPTIRKKAYF